jgi:hypothetical protein
LARRSREAEAAASAAAARADEASRGAAAGAGGSVAASGTPAVTPAGIPEILKGSDRAMLDRLKILGDVVEVTGKPGVYAVAVKTDKVIALLLKHNINLADLLRGGTFTKQDGNPQTVNDISITDIGDPISEYRGNLVNLDFWRQENVRCELAKLPELAGLNVDFFEADEASQVGADLNNNGVKFYKSGRGWFWAPKKLANVPVRDLLQRLTSLVGYRLGGWDMGRGFWFDGDPDDRGYGGGLVVRIQR